MRNIEINYGPFDLELEIEIVSFHVQPEEKMTRNYPGCPAEFIIEEIEVYLIPCENVDDDDLDLIVEIDRVRRAILSGEIADDILENDENFYDKAVEEYVTTSSPY